jgi:hypothetical protein
LQKSEATTLQRFTGVARRGKLKGDIAGGNADVSAAEKIDPKILPSR